MLTEANLNKMNKNELIKLLMDKQQECLNLQKITDQLKSVEMRLSQLESTLTVSTNTSYLLSKRVKKLEVDLLNSQQYSRRECIEIDGIPKSTKDSDLESSFVDILKEIDITVNPITDIQACHRIGNRGTVIIKLTNRKNVGKILSKKKNLDGREGGNIFINESLCPLNRKLRGCCNALKKN